MTKRSYIKRFEALSPDRQAQQLNEAAIQADNENFDLLKKILSDPYYIFIKAKFSKKGIDDLIEDYRLLQNDKDISFIQGLLTLIRVQESLNPDDILSQLIFFIGKERNSFIEKFLRKINNQTPYFKITQTTHRYNLKTLERVDKTKWGNLSLSEGRELATYSKNEINGLFRTPAGSYFMFNKRQKELILWKSLKHGYKTISFNGIRGDISEVIPYFNEREFLCVENKGGETQSTLVIFDIENNTIEKLYSSKKVITAIVIINSETIVFCEQYEVYELRNRTVFWRCSVNLELNNEGIKQILHNQTNGEYYLVGHAFIFFLDRNFNYDLKIDVSEELGLGTEPKYRYDVQRARLSNKYIVVSTETRLVVIDVFKKEVVKKTNAFIGTPLCITKDNAAILKDNELLKVYHIEQDILYLLENPFPKTLFCELSHDNQHITYIHENGIISQWKNIDQLSEMIKIPLDKKLEIEAGKTVEVFYFRKRDAVILLTEKFLHFATEAKIPRYVINKKITSAKISEENEQIIILEEHVLWSINIVTKELWRVDFNSDWKHKPGAEFISFEIYEKSGLLFCLREFRNWDNDTYEYIGTFFEIASGKIIREFLTSNLGINIPYSNNRRHRSSRNRKSDSLFVFMENLRLLTIILNDSLLVINPFAPVCELKRIIKIKKDQQTKFKYAHYTNKDSRDIRLLSYGIGFVINIENGIVQEKNGFSFFIDNAILDYKEKYSVLFDTENNISLYDREKNEILTAINLESMGITNQSDILARHYNFKKDVLIVSTQSKISFISLLHRRIILTLNTIFPLLSIVETTENLYMLGDNKGFLYEASLENYSEYFNS